MSRNEQATPPLTASEMDAREIFIRALEECSIERALAKKLVVTDRESPNVVAADALLRLSGIRRLIVIAMGKAGATMLSAVLNRPDIVSGKDVRGVLIAPDPLEPMPPGFAFFAGAHPLPNETSFAAAQAVLHLLQQEERSAQTLCLFLISGGASAMCELPLDPAISLGDTVAFHRALVQSGASIAEMNCVRKHFSAVKGGRLSLAAAHLRRFSLLVSDVAPQHIDALASGPTLPDTSTLAECRQILEKFDLNRQLPLSVAKFFASDAIPETPKPAAFVAPHQVVLSSADLAEQARIAAESLGYRTFVDNRCDDWEYREAAGYLLERARGLKAQYGRVCLVSAGEISVRLPQGVDPRREPPRGGRNQHFVLYAATQMSVADRGLTVLSCGSDGIDGNSPAAGAVVSYASTERPSRPQWVGSAQQALQTFSSFDFLRAQGRAIQTGPTGNNLRDLRLLLFP